MFLTAFPMAFPVPVPQTAPLFPFPGPLPSVPRTGTFVRSRERNNAERGNGVGKGACLLSGTRLDSRQGRAYMRGEARVRVSSNSTHGALRLLRH